MASITIPRRRIPLADRLWAKVDRRGPAECWPWRGSTGSGKTGGYGQISVPGGNHKRIGAHVAAYIITWGPVPAGMDVCHTCDYPLCCNPAHLVAATAKENSQDAIAKGRFIPGMRNPPRGMAHPRARLTDDQIVRIRDLADQGMSRRVLGKQFGVSNVAITMIVNRRTWSHIKETQSAYSPGTAHTDTTEVA